jgi:hypothetical protein
MKIAVNTTNRTLPLNLAPRQDGDKQVRREEMLLPFGSRDAEGKLLDRVSVSDDDIKCLDLACLIEREEVRLEESQPVADTPADDVPSVKNKRARS